MPLGITACIRAFAREDADVKQAAVDALAEWYFASSYRVPMGTEEADEAIASWLNQQTGGLLSEETGNIHTEKENLLRLYNTIYYKAGWLNAFESGQTGTDTFTAADGSKQQVDFMHRTGEGTYRKGASNSSWMPQGPQWMGHFARRFPRRCGYARLFFSRSHLPRVEAARR